MHLFYVLVLIPKFHGKVSIGSQGEIPVALIVSKNELFRGCNDVLLMSFQSPSPAMSRMGWALRTLLVADSGSCLRDRKVSGGEFGS